MPAQRTCALSPFFCPSFSYSDIWRNYSKSRKQLMQKIFLTTQQGATTSLAAATMDWDELQPSSALTEPPYLQPYRLPGNKKRPPYPLFEMLGPYLGYQLTQPRLPSDGGLAASQSMFHVCEELTNCKYKEVLSFISFKFILFLEKNMKKPFD